MSIILLVEDEKSIAEPLSDTFRREGYQVVVAETARGAREAINEASLVVLDWMLPDEQGIDLLRDWRSEGCTTPIIFLSARIDLIDRVLALEMGADDFVTKPFEPRELLARVRVCLRRDRGQKTLPEKSRLIVEISGLTLEMDPDQRGVVWGGVQLELTKMEFELLQFFLRHPGRVFSRDELLDQVWGYDAYPTTRTVDTHVGQLRRKLPGSSFESVRGVGYRFRPTRESGV